MGSSDNKLVNNIDDQYNFWATHESTTIRFKKELSLSSMQSYQVQT